MLFESEKPALISGFSPKNTANLEGIGFHIYFKANESFCENEFKKYKVVLTIPGELYGVRVNNHCVRYKLLQFTQMPE